MRDDIPGPEELEHLIRSRRACPDVDHDGHSSSFGGLKGALERIQAHLTYGLAVHTALHTDKKAFVALKHTSTKFRVAQFTPSALAILGNETDGAYVEEGPDPQRSKA
jgi:hypothetical protein